VTAPPLKVARRSAVAPFIVMEVMRAANARAAAGEGVVHLEVGQPGTSAPRPVIEAATRALTQSRLGYTEALGVPELRARIAAHYRSHYGVKVPAERIVVTTGSSGAFILSFLACFEPGDRVALASPSYPAYRNILKALDVEPVLLPATAATRFYPTPEMLDAVPGTLAGLIVASPNNPTGTMLSPAALGDLAAACAARGIRLISDEIYHGITFGMREATALSLGDGPVVINSFSKYFSMTGWRLGWMVVPEDLVRPVELLAQNLFISPPTLPQLAAVAAFDATEELDANVARYRVNRDFLLRKLPRIGFESFAPADGAFYLYADVGHLTNDSVDFCRRALAEAGVAITPGVDFDPERGHRTIRFSYAGIAADIEDAVARLKAWRRR